jgi:hypothetical protein
MKGTMAYLSLVKKITLYKMCMIRGIAMSSVNLVPLFFPNCRETTTTERVSLFVLPVSMTKSAKISPPLRVSNSAVYVPNPYGKFPGCFCPLYYSTCDLCPSCVHTVKKIHSYFVQGNTPVFHLGVSNKIQIFDIVH